MPRARVRPRSRKQPPDRDCQQEREVDQSQHAGKKSADPFGGGDAGGP